MKFITAIASMFLASSMALAREPVGGQQRMPVRYYGTASSTTTGSASLVFTISGLKSTDACVVTPVSYGTGPARLSRATATLNTLTVVADATQTAGTTVVAYVCFKP